MTFLEMDSCGLTKEKGLTVRCPGVEGSDWTLGAAMIAFGFPLIMYVNSLPLGWPLGAHCPPDRPVHHNIPEKETSLRQSPGPTAVDLRGAVGEAMAEDSSLSSFVV